jgi:hypothetical protein
LGFALRFHHFVQTGEYIRSRDDLAERYPVLALDPAGDWQQILRECVRICEEIIWTEERR